MHTSKSHAERAMEQNFVTMFEHFLDLKKKYHITGHSVPVPIKDEIYVGEDGARYKFDKIKLISLYVNGCTAENKTLREVIIKSYDADLVHHTETKFLDNSSVTVDGYKSFEFYQLTLVKFMNTKSGSGGVYVLLRSNLLIDYLKEVINQDFEGILDIKLQHKSSNPMLCDIFCYLPLQNFIKASKYHNDFDKFADNPYDCTGMNMMCICGDFNAEIGNKKTMM